MPQRRDFLKVFGACAAATAAASASPAMAWTGKALRVLVPAPPGGAFDLVARLLGEQLSVNLGQPVIVENKPGGAGNIAMAALLSAPTDGQTLLINTTNLFTEIPHVMPVAFDPLKDVMPVAALARSDLILIGSSALDPRDLASLIQYAKARPGQLSYASYSAGTISHYAGAMMNQKAGIDLQHIPFPGSPAALPQVISGQVTVMYNGMVNSLPMIRSGKVRAYAVAAKQRSGHLPRVPTFAELGYPEMVFGAWGGVFVSGKTSRELAQKIHDEVYKAALTPKVQQRIADMGFDVLPEQSIGDLGLQLRSEFERNAAIVKAYRIVAS